MSDSGGSLTPRRNVVKRNAIRRGSSEEKVKCDENEWSSVQSDVFEISLRAWIRD